VTRKSPEMHNRNYIRYTVIKQVLQILLSMMIRIKKLKRILDIKRTFGVV